MTNQTLDSLLAAPVPGGFDPARSPVWLWNGDARRVLWASRGALVLSGVRDLETLRGQVFGAAAPGLQRLAELGRQMRPEAPPRLERLQFFFDARSEILTCLCKLVALRDGGYGLLVAAFGMRVTAPEDIGPAEEETAEEPEVRQAEAPAAPEAPRFAAPRLVVTSEADGDEAPVEKPAPFGRRKPASPNWLYREPGERRALRFTWSSDGAGRLTTLSPAFAEATGLEAASLIGRTWDKVLDACEIDGKDDLAHFLSTTTTWSAVKVGWHMPGVAVPLPIELSAMPTFDLERRFSGFRGFGLFRLERMGEVAARAWRAPEAALTPERDATPDVDQHAEAPALEAPQEVTAIGPRPGGGPDLSQSEAGPAAEPEALAPVAMEASPAETPAIEPESAPEAPEPVEMEASPPETPAPEPEPALAAPEPVELETSSPETLATEPEQALALAAPVPVEIEASPPETPAPESALGLAVPAPVERETSPSETPVPEPEPAFAAPKPVELETSPSDTPATESALGLAVPAPVERETSPSETPVPEPEPAFAAPEPVEMETSPSEPPAPAPEPVPATPAPVEMETSPPETPATGPEPALAALEPVEMEAPPSEPPAPAPEPALAALEPVEMETSPSEPAAPAPEPAPAAPEAPRLPAATVPDQVVSLTRLTTTVGAHLGSPKIVPFRVSPASAAPRDVESSNLSSAERNAFREIAKVLGARLPDETAATVALKEAAPAPAGADTALPEDSLPESVAPETALLADALPDVVVSDEAPLAEFPETVTPVRPAAPPSVPAPAPAAPVERTLPDPLINAAGLLLERLPYGVLVLRGDAPIYANQAFLTLSGFEDVGEIIREHGVTRLFQGRATDAGRAGRVMIGRRDGASFPADVTVQSVDWAGAPATAMLFRRAVEVENLPGHDSLQLELAARLRENREARAILDTATDGIITLDARGRILGLNRSAEALFGFDQNEITGESFTMLLSPESHPAALDYLEGLKANGVATLLNDGREVMARERKGGRIPLFMTIGRVSADGDEPKFAAVLRDITNWKRAEAELTDAKRQADRASAQKSDFLAKISHEIRTPLNAIIGFAEVMKQEQLGPIGNERYKEYLSDIHVSGQHVMSLINDLLDLSKIEAGRMELAFTSVDLNDIVAGCIAIMQPQANRDHVIMRSHLAPRLPRVVADERSVRQIVLNLLSNASKFTDAGGQVIVSTALTDRGEAVIRVRDTGVGMNDKDIQTALEPFRRVPTSHPRSGTGLGLPLTKALTEANRANLSIQSKPREGTLVEVTFPPTRVLAE